MRGFRELYGNSILDILEVYKGSVKITIVDFVFFFDSQRVGSLHPLSCHAEDNHHGRKTGVGGGDAEWHTHCSVLK